MKPLLLCLFVCLPVLAQTDITGKWTGSQFTINFKQDGAKLSGTAGPTSSQQFPLQDATIDGDHLTFRVGTYTFDLHMDGKAIRGQANMGGQPTPVILERVEALASGQTLAFEVASVKRTPADAPPGSQSKLDPGHVTFTGVTLQALIRRAYDVKGYQISGPDWINTERYEISAKFPAKYGVDQIVVMLQNLLAERFKLTIRRDTREMPVYALVLGKGGLKNAKETELGPGGISTNPGKMTATKINMARLAEALSNRVDRPVIDMTGLNGIYDLTLEWAPDQTATSDNGPTADIYTALQQQLGLRLESRKAPMELLVVERAERTPTENL
jgi:uncharacterized protein (TIGR03435 family)